MTKLWQVAAGVGLFILGGVIALGVRAMAVPAQGAVTTITSAGDWRLVCLPEPKGQCSLQQDVAAATGGTMLLRLVLTDSDKPQLAIIVPHGVLLPPGIGLVVGKAAMRIRPYQVCDDAGCLARIDYDQALARDFAAATDGRVVFAARDDKPLAIRFSLKGFSAGVAEMKHAEARRAHWWARIVGA